MIRSFPPHPNPPPPRGEGKPFIPPAELGGILAYFYKFVCVSVVQVDVTDFFTPSQDWFGGTGKGDDLDSARFIGSDHEWASPGWTLWNRGHRHVDDLRNRAP